MDQSHCALEVVGLKDAVKSVASLLKDIERNQHKAAVAKMTESARVILYMYIHLNLRTVP